MTTLVWRAGVLASDSRTCIGDVIQPGAWPKVGRLDDGRAWGYCGNTADATVFIAALNAGTAAKLGDATLVVIGEHIEVFEDEGSFRVPPSTEFMAWGSGRAAALGALYVGADARAAVEAACQVDANSGGPVQSLTVRPVLAVVASSSERTGRKRAR
jgi:ATP-dependent protease HslVU (ClpYQ) peptidase subunit